MTMEMNGGVLVCADTLSVDDAEALQQYLLGASDAMPPGADLAACTHVHSACLQVLMAARPPVAAWPRDPALALWLQAALN